MTWGSKAEVPSLRGSWSTGQDLAGAAQGSSWWLTHSWLCLSTTGAREADRERTSLQLAGGRLQARCRLS